MGPLLENIGKSLQGKPLEEEELLGISLTVADIIKFHLRNTNPSMMSSNHFPNFSYDSENKKTTIKIKIHGESSTETPVFIDQEGRGFINKNIDGEDIRTGIYFDYVKQEYQLLEDGETHADVSIIQVFSSNPAYADRNKPEISITNDIRHGYVNIFGNKVYGYIYSGTKEGVLYSTHYKHQAKYISIKYDENLRRPRWIIVKGEEFKIPDKVKSLFKKEVVDFEVTDEKVLPADKKGIHIALKNNKQYIKLNDDYYLVEFEDKGDDKEEITLKDDNNLQTLCEIERTKRGIGSSCMPLITVYKASRNLTVKQEIDDFNLKQAKAIEKSRREKITERLTEPEKIIINKYTTGTGYFYPEGKATRINKPLYSDGLENALLLDNALESIGYEKKPLTLYRAITLPIEMPIKIKNGDLVCPGIFSSTSLSREVSERFFTIMDTEKRKKVMLVFKTKKCANISELSDYQGEVGQAEMVIRPHELFNVLYVHKRNGVTYIVLNDKIEQLMYSAHSKNVKDLYTGEPIKEPYFFNRNDMLGFYDRVV